ncbi:alpha/beta hydrolase [Nonlabens marinus]|uniref:Putative alpha-dextrin endo-1, 6-alpha-glucosidase n=1 Tax=Nonlabens marinus S1-08 TaxID=1454201 RepID=W8VSH1_9FLAO|nr:alpha/beta hydrolase-fold protein [Nonlabens marinus]BAO56190.1 putative alpha-dextrin endo-1, 6-alpha-glucosidase [Nonlabens marinus S1-08]
MKQLFQLNTALIAILLLSYSSIFAQITLKVTVRSSDMLAGDQIYVAGDFNNWNPNSDEYRLEENENGFYSLSFYPSLGEHDFKFTKGSWSNVEVDKDGQDLGNRKFTYSGKPKQIELHISNWKDARTTAVDPPKNVTIISEDFDIPQLERSRRIWVYLPPDYDASNKSYPVLYMQDGQNLFDAATSYSEEWEIDESLNKMFQGGDQGVIVVGIDNGGSTRLDEYSPWVNSNYGGGEGASYVNFLVETLKPYIDSNFRTKPDRTNTGIMGSSMGGLISFYAAIERQDIFSKAGVFSPSFWFSDRVYDHVRTTGKNNDMRIVLLGGAKEGAGLVQNIDDMIKTLHKAGFGEPEIKRVILPDGAHSEWFWRREFPESYMWLFNENNLSQD